MIFTDEVKEEDSIPFLDIKITRNNVTNTLNTNVYRKPTFSGVFSNYESFIPLCFKIGLLMTLLFRAFTICSNVELRNAEFSKLKNILLKNAYPADMIDKCVASFMNKRSTSPTQTVKKREVSINLPFLGKISLELKKRLNRIVQKHLRNCVLRVTFNSGRRLSSVFSFKDKILQEEKATRTMFKVKRHSLY